MFTRLRSTWTAGGGAVLLVIALSGVVAGANLLSDTLPTGEADAAPLVDTTATWEDTDGNGVDDDCQEAVVADPEAAATAEAAVDLDGDGTVSVPEAAQSDRTGGVNCNHGGYVSIVAQGDDAEATEAEETAEEVAAECEATEDPVPEPTPETETEVVAANAHGKAVSEVAKSDAVGGKNCNHGGAVSEAAKDKTLRDAAKAARDAAKAERAEARAAAKANRDAAKAERAAARAAAKAARQAKHGN